MNTPKEYRGLWYLPENPENKIGGILTFDDSVKISLELFGCFDENPDYIKKLFEKEVTTLNTIYGITSDSKKITLFDCYEYLNINSANNVYLSNYTCRYVIEGDHFESINGKNFYKIACHSPLISLWKHPGIIKNSFSFCDQEETIKRVTVSADKNSYWEKAFNINNNYKLLLNSEGNFNNDFQRTKFEFTQTTRLSITCPIEKKSMPELLEKLILGYNFITLATMSLSGISNILLYTEESNNSNPITLYYAKKKEKQTKVHLENFLFSYDSIEDIFSEVILKWFQESERLAPIRNHLIHSIQSKNSFLSIDFLTLVQSLEGYHRRFINHKDLNLKSRLKELLFLFNTVEVIRECNINLEVIVKTRNYYSHFFDKVDKVLSGQNLYNETKKLRVLLICCILSLTGFSNDKINELLNKRQSYIH